ncbi:MAG: hypothetical protein H0W73_08790 [Bacteroidetes bacterium]|nr:hypothetical protein [Bacteroidota bacterium]
MANLAASSYREALLFRSVGKLNARFKKLNEKKKRVNESTKSPTEGEKEVQKESTEYNEQVPLNHPHGEKEKDLKENGKEEELLHPHTTITTIAKLK